MGRRDHLRPYINTPAAMTAQAAGPMPSIQGEAMELFTRVPPLPINSARGGVGNRGSYLESPAAAAAAAAVVSTRKPSTSGGLMISRAGGGDQGKVKRQQEAKAKGGTGGDRPPRSRSRGGDKNGGDRGHSGGSGGNPQVSFTSMANRMSDHEQQFISRTILKHENAPPGYWKLYTIAELKGCSCCRCRPSNNGVPYVADDGG